MSSALPTTATPPTLPTAAAISDAKSASHDLESISKARGGMLFRYEEKSSVEWLASVFHGEPESRSRDQAQC
jgi:hypothetical protein